MRSPLAADKPLNECGRERMCESVITGLHHIAILCAEREASLWFYETLGFRVTESHVRPERNDEVIFMSGSGIVLELFIADKHPQRVTSPEAYGLRHLALGTDDAQAIREKLISAGYTPEPIRTDTFNGRRLFFVKDPDGLPIELHE